MINIAPDATAIDRPSGRLRCCEGRWGRWRGPRPKPRNRHHGAHRNGWRAHHIVWRTQAITSAHRPGDEAHQAGRQPDL